MSAIDGILFFAFLAYVVWDGIRRGRKNHDSDDYFLAGRTIPWWAMGLSIMATQASAITMIGTTGQGWHDGMRFLQFYFALPLAMVILCFTAVPVFHRLRVTTAYEYLGKRFDGRTRLLSAVLFLILRGLSLGFVIYTPSVVLAKVVSVPQPILIVAMGAIAMAYTTFGGLRAVIATDVKQFTVMVGGLLVTFVVLIAQLPEDIDLAAATKLATEAGRMELVSLEWNPNEKYTLWSSLFGGLFLFLSYFGTDQSQVQRYLAGRSLRDKQGAMLFNAVCKVPFQFFVLFLGVLLFVFYVFHAPPMNFVPSSPAPASSQAAYETLVSQHERQHLELSREARGVIESWRAGDTDGTESAASRFRDQLDAVARTRADAAALREQSVSETNYVFPHFILNHLPVGIVGLLFAAIFAAFLSSMDSELNSMATVAVVDIYEYGAGRSIEGARLLLVSRWVTIAVGAFATCFALFAGEIGSLIEAVNRVGSYIYGSLLGVFVLSMVPFAHGRGSFFGLITGMVVVAEAARAKYDLAFLYLNTIGTLTVLGVGCVLSLLLPAPPPAQSKLDGPGPSR